MSDSPLSQICAWIESLAPETQKELAVELVASAPIGLHEDHLDPARLVETLRVLGTDPKKEAGMAAMMAGLIDYLFVDRADPTAWSKNDQLLNLLSEVKELAGGAADELNAWIQNTQLRNPLRSRQWQKAFESWRPIRESALSNHAISDWFKSAVLPTEPAPS